MPGAKWKPPRPAVSHSNTLRDLISYRVHKLAGALSRGAAMRYRREFDVSLVEWRTIALLGDFAPLSLKQLATLAALDKSLVSRTVSTLAERGLVQRETSSADAREVELRLTEAGAQVFEGLVRAARERDAAFRAALTPEELAVLDDLLKRLEAEAWKQS